MTENFLIADFFLLLIIFIGAWEFWLLRTKRGRINYIDNFIFASLYFFFWSVALVLAFPDKIVRAVAEFDVVPMYALAVFLVVNFLAFYFTRRYLSRPVKLIEKYPLEPFLKMDYRYIASNVFDVLFQQTTILLIVLFLKDAGLSLPGIIMSFGIIFGILHLPLFKIKGKYFGWYYTIAAIFSATVFPILITQVHYGFVYSYMAHVLFYTGSGIIFWWRHD